MSLFAALGSYQAFEPVIGKARDGRKDSEDIVEHGSREMPFVKDTLVFRDMLSAFRTALA